MKRVWVLLAAALLATALLAGCGGGSGSNPFTGMWISPHATEITFESSTWFDSLGNQGPYSFDGSDPTYTLTLGSDAAARIYRATFLDASTMQLCSVGTGGAVFACEDYVADRPIVPN
jgi:hypothetical protein